MKMWLPLLVLSVAACRAPTQAPVANSAADPAPARSTVAPSPAAVADRSIPLPVRGKWRQSTAATVTAADCQDYEAANMGKIIVIGAKRFSIFEEGGRLLTVHERGPRRIRATFDTTYADTPTRADYDFDAQDDGRTLIVRVSGDGAVSGPTRYLRCPE